MRRAATHTARGDAGMSMIEILIALFVFMVGVLGIFAILPVAMDQSSRAVRGTRGGVIAQYAVATLNAQIQRAMAEYTTTTVTDDVYGGKPVTRIAVEGTPAWSVDYWSQRGMFGGMLTGTGFGKGGRVLYNSASEVYVHPRLAGAGAPNRLRLDLTGLAVVAAATPSSMTRAGAIQGVEALYYHNNPPQGYPDNAKKILKTPDPATANYRCLVTDRADTSETDAGGVANHPWLSVAVRDEAKNGSSNTLGVNGNPWTVNEHAGRICVLRQAKGQARTIVSNTRDTLTLSPDWDDPPGNKTPFEIVDNAAFILITSGRAAGKVYQLCAVLDGATTQYDTGDALANQNDRLVCDYGDFRRDGVRQGDTYTIIGNKTGILSHPGNAFGHTDRTQVEDEPTFTTGKAEYAFAVVFSDTGGLGGSVTGPASVRVDVLVFRDYDSRKMPAENKRAVTAQTAYLMP